jgi:putative toxin-antitoxin system antitoxin component (TIGR02293 family)
MLLHMKYSLPEEPTPVVREISGETIEQPGYWVSRVQAGLSVEEFDVLREMLGLSVERLAAHIGISVATLSRRRAARQSLDRDHGDRLVRYARLFWQAVAFFDGDESAARDWLGRPARGLGGATPLEFAETEIGAREVEDLIGRLEFGVYV